MHICGAWVLPSRGRRKRRYNDTIRDLLVPARAPHPEVEVPDEIVKGKGLPWIAGPKTSKHDLAMDPRWGVARGRGGNLVEGV